MRGDRGSRARHGHPLRRGLRGNGAVFVSAQTQWLHNRVAIPVHIAKAVYVSTFGGAAVYYVDNQPDMEWKTI